MILADVLTTQTPGRCPSCRMEARDQQEIPGDVFDALAELERAQDALLDDAQGDGLPSTPHHQRALARRMLELRERLQRLAQRLDGVTP